MEDFSTKAFIPAILTGKPNEILTNFAKKQNFPSLLMTTLKKHCRSKNIL